VVISSQHQGKRAACAANQRAPSPVEPISLRPPKAEARFAHFPFFAQKEGKTQQIIQNLTLRALAFERADANQQSAAYSRVAHLDTEWTTDSPADGSV
jgi:hypothetical protein